MVRVGTGLDTELDEVFSASYFLQPSSEAKSYSVPFGSLGSRRSPGWTVRKPLLAPGC